MQVGKIIPFAVSTSRSLHIFFFVFCGFGSIWGRRLVSLSAAEESLVMWESRRIGGACREPAVAGPGLELALGGCDWASRGEYDRDDLELQGLGDVATVNTQEEGSIILGDGENVDRSELGPSPQQFMGFGWLEVTGSKVEAFKGTWKRPGLITHSCRDFWSRLTCRGFEAMPTSAIISRNSSSPASQSCWTSSPPISRRVS